MNTEALFFIILAFWIFVLQSKIKHLEKLVYGLTSRRGKEQTEVSTVVDQEPGTGFEEAEKVVTNEAVEVQDAGEEISGVETFKQEYREPGVTQQRAESSVVTTWLRNYFTGGNLLVRIGGVVLFFGLAFLVKYAAEHSIISMEMRLWGIVLGAVVLMVIGWRLRDREGAYGQVLQGLGVAMLYLVIYGALKFYGLLSLETAFLLMLLVVIIGSVLAVIEDALPLALFASAGGFMVPILTSSGDGSHVMLFSYYVFLNLGIFIVAWYRSWRVLNVLGFVFTFIIATVWGVLRYREEIFESTEPFLLIFFMMYLSISILFTIKHPYEPKNLVDGTLVFGLPVVALPLQLSLVQHFDYGEAYSAVALGVLYAGLYWLLKNKERTGLLAHSFLALSVVFFTIAVPYIFDADVSAALWSLEACGAMWIAVKQEQKIARYFGMLLLTVSLFVYPDAVEGHGLTAAEYLGYLVVIFAAYTGAYLLDTCKQRLPHFDKNVSKIFIAVGMIWWFRANLSMLHNYWHSYIQGQDILLVLLAAVVLLLVAERLLKWRMLIGLLQLALPFSLSVFLYFIGSDSLFFHPFADWGVVLLTALFLLQFWMLYLYRNQWHYDKVLHLLTFWFVVLVAAMEIYYHVELKEYKAVSLGLLPLMTAPLLASFLVLLPAQYHNWLEVYRRYYQIVGAGALIVCLLLWEVSAFGRISPYVQNYFPLLNILDMMQIMVILITGFWLYRNKVHLDHSVQSVGYGALGLLGLVLASVIFARAVHAYRDIPYTISALWQSDYFQTGLSLLWSIVAIVLMLLSKRYINRPFWLGGFSLLLVVVLKLFFVELSQSGTIERIVSFMVVGGLLLLIGYFVPLPPKMEKKDE